MKRRATILIVSLALGAIVSVTVAHCVVIWGVRPKIGGGRLGQGVTPIASEIALWRHYAPGEPSESPFDAWEQSSFGKRTITLARDSTFLHERNAFIVWIVECGWPCRCTAKDGWIDYRNGQPPQKHEAGYRIGWLNLPSRLLWPGIVIDTTFYAAVLLALYATPLKIRRSRRIKRGLCPACAYPVGHSPICTECGGRLKKIL